MSVLQASEVWILEQNFQERHGLKLCGNTSVNRDSSSKKNSGNDNEKCSDSITGNKNSKSKNINSTSNNGNGTKPKH